MTETPRLNGIIRVWEEGRVATSCFSPATPLSATQLLNAPYDSVVFEMEHNPWDVNALQDSLQYLLSRKQILERGNLSPALTPVVRIPPNGGEKNQFFAKQALDRGLFGVIWPHVDDAEQAYNAVAACRYPRPPEAPFLEPKGLRGDGPHGAVRYWGLPLQDYYKRADVWPLNPQGEIIVFLMIEGVAAIHNLDEILGQVPGIGCVLIGEGDLGQELGHPREYDHPKLREAMAEIVGKCKKHKVKVGHPHVDAKNISRVLDEGYDLVITAPVVTYPAIDKLKELTKR